MNEVAPTSGKCDQKTALIPLRKRVHYMMVWLMLNSGGRPKLWQTKAKVLERQERRGRTSPIRRKISRNFGISARLRVGDTAHCLNIGKTDGIETFLTKGVPPTGQRAAPIMPDRTAKMKSIIACSVMNPVRLSICGNASDALWSTNVTLTSTAIPCTRTATKSTITIANRSRYMDGNDTRTKEEDFMHLQQD